MKITILIFILSLLASCSYHIIPPHKVDEILERKNKEKVSSSPYLDRFRNEISAIESTLEKINKHTYGVNNYQKNWVRILYAKNSKHMIYVNERDDLIINIKLLESMKRKLLSKNDMKAAVCHEYSHIINDDQGYKLMKSNNKVSMKFDISDFTETYYVDSDGERLSAYKNSKREYSSLMKYDDTFLLKNKYLYPLNVEVNADILAVDCLRRIGVKNGKDSIINLLRLLKHKFNADESRTNVRISSLMELK